MAKRYKHGGVTWESRCYASGHDRIEGSRIAVGAYPNQGLDLPEQSDPGDDLTRRSLAAKYICQRSPLGTWVDELVRLDNTGAVAQDGWSQHGDAWRPGDTNDQGAW